MKLSIAPSNPTCSGQVACGSRTKRNTVAMIAQHQANAAKRYGSVANATASSEAAWLGAASVVGCGDRVRDDSAKTNLGMDVTFQTDPSTRRKRSASPGHAS